MSGARRRYSLIDALLSYSRVSYAHNALEEVDFEAAIRDVFGNLKNTIEVSGATRSCIPLPKLSVNRAQIPQLFQNLVGNASKFCSGKPPHIQTTANQTENRWHFSVNDSGISIPAEFRERVFVIFQRLNCRKQYPGAGAGLAICKKIVVLHGRQIWGASKSGKGTTFHCTLPKPTSTY